MDFSYSAIPNEFPGASKDPLKQPSNMLFIPEGDNVAHNHMNFGNFLWGAAGATLGISWDVLRLGAEYNGVFNSRTNGYPPQLDSGDDQFSIQKGINYSEDRKFVERTWASHSGISNSPSTRQQQ